MKNTLYAILCFFLASHTLFSQENPLILNPALSPDGQTIAFNYQGDIWTASILGQNLKRLTIHEAYDTNPVWSPDGTSIAFQSDRFGNDDVFTINSIGGIPKRLTYHSANDQVTDYTTDDRILFTTVREFVEVEREPEVHYINASGGTPFRLLNALGFDATLSPNKKLIAFTRGSCRIEREAYKGPANRDIWVYNIDTDTYHQITTFNGQDLAPKWADNNTIYFQSAQSGKYNVHKVTINQNGEKNGDITQITFLNKIGLFSFNLSKNGTDLIMVYGDHLALVNVHTKKVTPIKITINSDYRFDPSERKTFTSNASELEVSPNGKLSAIVVRGEVFILENDPDKSRAVNISNSAYKDDNIAWINDNTLLFISDRNGVNNLYTVNSNDINNKNIFTSLKHKITQITTSKKGITSAKLSPNKKQIAYTDGYGTLITATITDDLKITNEITLLNGWDTPSGIAWSPDSKWISYSLSDLYFNDEVYIHKADNSLKPVNISMHPKADSRAIWSEDGSKIAFSSNRNNGDHDIWFVWLQKKDWEKTSQDWEETTEDKKEDSSEKSDTKTEKKIVDVIIDFDDIHERQQQVTSYNGGEYLTAISKDGKTFYYTTGNSGRGNPTVTSDLYQIQWNGKDNKEITSGDASPRNIIITDKEDYIYYLSKGKINRYKFTGTKKESIPFSAKMIINYTEEANQIFEEAWNTIEYRFYDPNHHGQNWDELKSIYKPLAIKASTREDFKYIFNSMLGQINASHMGMYRGEERKETQNETTGILGIELSPTNNGQLKVSKVVPNAAADRESSKLVTGDIITTVNGEKVSVSENIYKHLTASNNEKIILGVSSNGKEKEVVIRPKSNGRDDNYNAWVKERKQLTELYSNGRLGYIHIQGMNWESFERFERELTAAGNGKEGIVIDVRYNGGGWTTDYLMAILTVKQHAYTIPRGASDDLSKNHQAFKNYYPYSERLPLAAWAKPSVALCNQASYSNAEIFSHAYKELGLGKLVGIPTFGAVISTGGQTLIDGSYVRVPYRGWFVKSSEKNMDFYPAMPDVVIDNYPDEKAKGTDSQLKAAVNELLKTL